MFNQLSLHTINYPSDEFGKKKDREMENTSWCRSGSHPAMFSHFVMTYTTRPSQQLPPKTCEAIEEEPWQCVCWYRISAHY
uniref:Ovule protein n=1 Tax=Heterorhabditis bacteriophora TaxID=37862 RepID=A0A1I7X8Y7_HETBA